MICIKIACPTTALTWFYGNTVMKVSLKVRRSGVALYEGTYRVFDADSFGAACADIWAQLRKQRMAGTANVGALMESQEDSVIADLVGAEIAISDDR